MYIHRLCYNMQWQYRLSQLLGARCVPKQVSPQEFAWNWLAAKHLQWSLLQGSADVPGMPWVDAKVSKTRTTHRHISGQQGVCIDLTDASDLYVFVVFIRQMDVWESFQLTRNVQSIWIERTHGWEPIMTPKVFGWISFFYVFFIFFLWFVLLSYRSFVACFCCATSGHFAKALGQLGVRQVGGGLAGEQHLKPGTPRSINLL